MTVAAFGVFACSKSKGPTNPPEQPVAPNPDSPQNVLALIAWCWEMQDEGRYHGVFTDDYQYIYAPADSQGIGAGLNRAEELDAGDNLFGTGVPPAHPAPTRISFDYPAVTVQNDDRPGKNPTWHKMISTNVDVRVLTSTQDYATSGGMKFYFVRGDSAAIPAELGLGPDPNRWYVERWEDQLVCPKRCATVGKIKQDYQTP